MAKQKVKSSSVPMAAIVVIAIVLALAISYQEYLGSRLIEIHHYNATTTTSQAYCPYGYVCGMASDGCAVPGAVYNCPMIPANQTTNATIAVSLQQELNNSVLAGFTLNQTVFYSNSSLDCSRQLISYCDNNVPSQFVCVNQRYSALVSSQYNLTHKNLQACPMFLMAGTVSCGVQDGYCVVMESSPNIK